MPVRGVVPIQIQERDLLLLRGLFESRLFTQEHAATLYFDGRGEAAKKRLQKLKAAHLIGEKPRRPYHPAILYLTRKGFECLTERGAIADLPQLPWNSLEKRLQVKPLTLSHELEVMDVKAAISAAVRVRRELKLVEFGTWPRLYQFMAKRPAKPHEFTPAEVMVKPDGFFRIQELGEEGKSSEQMFFLEVDRGPETLDTLGDRAHGYGDFYRSGGMAQRFGYKKEEIDAAPFRLLMVFKTAERRNNIAARLLRNNPPPKTMVWLTTRDELRSDPLGAVWVRPLEYQAATKGTQFDATRQRGSPYLRDVEREAFIEANVPKMRLLDGG